MALDNVSLCSTFRYDDHYTFAAPPYVSRLCGLLVGRVAAVLALRSHVRWVPDDVVNVVVLCVCVCVSRSAEDSEHTARQEREDI